MTGTVTDQTCLCGAVLVRAPTWPCWDATNYERYTSRARTHYACPDCGCLFSRSPDTYQQRVALATAGHHRRWTHAVLELVEKHVDLDIDRVLDSVRERCSRRRNR